MGVTHPGIGRPHIYTILRHESAGQPKPALVIDVPLARHR